MKVLFAPTFTNHRFGGLGTFAENVIIGLVEEGIEPVVVVPPQRVPEKIEKHAEIVQVPFTIKNPGGRGWFLPDYKYMPFYFEDGQDLTLYFGWCLHAMRVLKSLGLLYKIDLVHTHDWMTYPLGYSCKTMGIPWLHTAHFITPCLWNVKGESERENPYFRYMLEIEKRATLDSDYCTTVSEYMRGLMALFFDASPSKVSVIYNGIDLMEWNSDKVAKFPLQKLGIEEDNFTLVYVGTGRAKGLDIVLGYANTLGYDDRVNLIVVTKRDKGYGGESIKKVISTCPNAAYISNLPHSELKSLFKTADAVLLPYTGEPFGLVVLEAMAMGTPPIVGNGGLREIVKRNVHGKYVDMEDPIASIKAKVTELRDNPELLKILSTNCLNRSREFPWSRAVNAYIKCYEEVIDFVEAKR
jgi:glycogen(starch) synthase